MSNRSIIYQFLIFSPYDPVKGVMMATAVNPEKSIPLYKLPQKKCLDRGIEITLMVLGILAILSGIGCGLGEWTQFFSLGTKAYGYLAGGIVLGVALIIGGIYQKAIYNHSVHGLESASSNNRKQKKLIESIRLAVQLAASDSRSGYGDSGYCYVVKPGWKEEAIGQFSITTENYNEMCDSINEAIDQYTQNSDLVFVHQRGSITNGAGEIKVQLTLFVKESN